ncbi:hypothetical protein PT274_03955 [Leuconostocaceae bacterium ESL0958]|nr:hypothetical protein [Leuconostocaceae bacterium ESL0958]
MVKKYHFYVNELVTAAQYRYLQEQLEPEELPAYEQHLHWGQKMDWLLLLTWVRDEMAADGERDATLTAIIDQLEEYYVLKDFLTSADYQRLSLLLGDLPVFGEKIPWEVKNELMDELAAQLTRLATKNGKQSQADFDFLLQVRDQLADYYPLAELLRPADYEVLATTFSMPAYQSQISAMDKEVLVDQIRALALSNEKTGISKKRWTELAAQLDDAY